MSQIQSYVERLEQASSIIISKLSKPIDFSIILGTGLGKLSELIDIEEIIPYVEIPGFPISTSPSHKGELIIGRFADCSIAMMNGRQHLYEGWSPIEIAFPIRVLATLGEKNLIITNAAGALNVDFQPGQMMLISDHINMTGENPLVGPHHESFGVRFPDMSDPYNKLIRSIARECLSKSNEEYYEGIYASITGPSLETSAERRFLRFAGADVVGMSTAMEVITAKQAGFNILGISAITNKAVGGPDQEQDTIEDVIRNAEIAGKKIIKNLPEIMLSWKGKFRNSGGDASEK